MNNDVFEFLCRTERSFCLTCKVLVNRRILFNVYGTEDDRGKITFHVVPLNVDDKDIPELIRMRNNIVY